MRFIISPARVHTGQARLPPITGGSCDHVFGLSELAWIDVLFLERFAGQAGVVFPVPAEGCARA
jgi:hypothetical protein